MPQTEIPAELVDRDGFLMGRFTSVHSRYSVAVDPGVEKLVTDVRGTSRMHQDSEPQIAQFEQSGLRDHEIADAFERWTFSGLAEGVNPVTTIGVYDPEANAIAADWSPEQRKKVERKLWLESVFHPGDLAFVPSPRARVPWPSYDHDNVEEILELQARLQIPPSQVRSYEEENAGRVTITKAMWDLEAAEGDPEKPVVTVGA